MFFSLLFDQPEIVLVWLAAILIGLTIHEFAHGLMAKICGDHTAERAGRLTLNPLAHLDWLGLIPLLLLGFGWAKPVPYNPHNLKNPRWDAAWVGLAGPIVNLLVAATAAGVLRLLLNEEWWLKINLLIVFLFFTVLINLLLMFFNLIPLDPLDGSKLLFAVLDSPRYAVARDWLAVHGRQILFIAVLLAIVTNLPIFFFISWPALVVCDFLSGENCSMVFGLIFNG